MTLTEDLLDNFGIDLTPSIDGAVRVGGGDSDYSLWAYKSFFQFQAGVDLTGLILEPLCS